MILNRERFWNTLLAALFLVLCCRYAPAERTEPLPEELKGVGVVQKPGAELPTGLEFRDHRGRTVRLGDYFGKDRPVVLTLNYARCPMLCYLQLDGLLSALRSVDLQLGEDYDVVTISIDPEETPERANQAREKYVAKYNRPVNAEAWPFLVGEERNIREVAATVGFNYRFDEKSGEFAHVATLIVCTPEGQVSQYVPGVMFEPKDLRLTLVDAAGGRIGNLADQFLLYCFAYDGESGSYVLAASRLMRIGGAIALVAFALFLLRLWRGERKRKARQARPNETGTTVGANSS